MLRQRHLRSVLCVLLAVSTAVGSAPAFVKACTCSAAPPAKVVAAPEPIPTTGCCGKTCCGLNCCEPTSAQSQLNQPAGSCGCLACDCRSPAVPRPADSMPPPPPVDSSTLQFASAPPAPPVFLAISSEAFPRFGEACAEPPPVDLVTVLSRLTC
jgi:hypothetical protein